MEAFNPARWSTLRRAVTLIVVLALIIAGAVWFMSTRENPEAKTSAPISTAPMSATANPSPEEAETSSAADPTIDETGPAPTSSPSQHATAEGIASVTAAAQKNAAGFISAYYAISPGMTCPIDWLNGIAPFVHGGLEGAKRMFAMSDAGAPTQQACDAWEAKNTSQTVADAYASAEYVNNQVQGYGTLVVVDKAGVKSEKQKTFSLTFDPDTQRINALVDEVR